MQIQEQEWITLQAFEAVRTDGQWNAGPSRLDFWVFVVLKIWLVQNLSQNNKTKPLIFQCSTEASYLKGLFAVSAAMLSFLPPSSPDIFSNCSGDVSSSLLLCRHAAPISEELSSPEQCLGMHQLLYTQQQMLHGPWSSGAVRLWY